MDFPPEFPRRTLRERLLGIPLRLTIICAIVFGAGWLLYRSVVHRPEEKYRVAHPAGYSVIRPSDWSASVMSRGTGPDSGDVRDSIDLAPITWKGREPSMWVRRFNHPPDLQDLQAKGFVAGKFLNFDGVVRTQHQKWVTTRIAIFKAGEDWFDIGVTVPGAEVLRLEDWWEYMQTFQLGSASPATQQK